MIPAALFLLTLAVAARAWRTRRAPESGEVRTRLARLAIATVLTRVLLELVDLPGLRPFAMPLAVLVIVALARGPWPALALLTLIVLLAFRWRAVLSTRQSFAAGLGGVALLLLSLRRWVQTPDPVMLTAAPTLKSLLHYAKLRADGGLEWLSAGGLILGILAGSRFESGEVQLHAGDLLALYTDGVTEGADSTAEQFGEDRMVEALRRRFAEPAAAIAMGLVREVRRFEGESGPADDITVLVARRLPAAE